MDLLEPPHIPSEASNPRSLKLSQTLEVHGPLVVVGQPVAHLDDFNRKLSFQPSGVRTATCTSEAQRNTESRKSSRQELLSTSTGLMLRQPHTNSFTHDAHTVAFSQLSFSDNKYLSECSSIPRYRAVPQIVTTQVPQTVPEELTSRSNTVDIIVPPIPIRQAEDRRRPSQQQASEVSQRQPPGQYNSVRYTQPQGATSARGHVSARQSVGGGKNMVLREVESVNNNHSPQAEDQQKLPMRFRHIESIGEDIDVGGDDASSEVLGHYNPSQELPIKKLLNRMSEPPDFHPQEEFYVNPQHSYSSRSKQDHNFGVSPQSLTARLERLKRVSPSKEEDR